ncbi:MAG: hypothetical protein R6V85_11220 [Polyangia bacterium]
MAAQRARGAVELPGGAVDRGVLPGGGDQPREDADDSPMAGLTPIDWHPAGAPRRCGRIVDLYVVPCPEKDYEIYMDMYHCSPLDE